MKKKDKIYPICAAFCVCLLIFALGVGLLQVSYKQIVSFIEPYRGGDWTVHFPNSPAVQCSEPQIDYAIDMFSHLTYSSVLNPDKYIEVKDDSVSFEITAHNSLGEQVLHISVFSVNSKNYMLLQDSVETYVYKVSEIGAYSRISNFAIDVKNN